MSVLRAARSTDAGAVGTILSEFIDTTDWMPRIHTRAEDLAHAGSMIARGWVTVAEQGRHVVGFAALNGKEVNALYVAAAVRGQGVGTALLHHLQKAQDTLALWTFQQNEGAQRFYLRHGFVEMDRTEGQTNDEGLPDILYAWQRKAV